MRYEFPERGVPLDAAWKRPLEAVARAVVEVWRYQFFDVGDFMIMSRIVRPPRPSLVLYKHFYTRRYLNLDDAGHAYRYLAAKPASTRSGQYRAHRDLTAALDNLDLWELPWFKAGLEQYRFGYSFEERYLARDMLDPIDDLEPWPNRRRGHLRLL